MLNDFANEDEMTDYTPVNPKLYTADELRQAIGLLQYLHAECERGNIIQHASPALLIAIDCVAYARFIPEILLAARQMGLEYSQIKEIYKRTKWLTYDNLDGAGGG